MKGIVRAMLLFNSHCGKNCIPSSMTVWIARSADLPPSAGIFAADETQRGPSLPRSAEDGPCGQTPALGSISRALTRRGAAHGHTRTQDL